MIEQFCALLLCYVLYSFNFLQCCWADPTAIPNSVMTAWLAQDHASLARLNAPVWFFAGLREGASWVPATPCVPTWAFGLDPSSQPHDAQHRTPPAKRCRAFTPWDRNYISCDCQRPDQNIGRAAPDFPVYFTVKQCGPNDIRVSLNLFYQKDGYIVGWAKDSGHDWDWERVVIHYVKSGQGSSATWSASSMAASYHSDYNINLWKDIQNTLTSTEANSPDPRAPQGITNNDHPKVYVSTVKHSNFFEKNTGWPQALAQYTSRAFRSDDWWHFVKPENFIEVPGDSNINNVFSSLDWGQADTPPPVANDRMCGIPFSVPNPNKKRERMPINPVAFRQSQVYVNPATYVSDRGNFSFSELPASAAYGLPAMLIDELRAQGFRGNASSNQTVISAGNTTTYGSVNPTGEAFKAGIQVIEYTESASAGSPSTFASIAQPCPTNLEPYGTTDLSRRAALKEGICQPVGTS